MSRLLLLVALVAGTTVTGACARSSTGAAGVELGTEDTHPPYMKQRNDRPNIRDTSGGMDRVTVEVPVDEFGNVSTSQLRIFGNISPTAKQELIAWLASGQFVPATSRGVPVAGIYKFQL